VAKTVVAGIAAASRHNGSRYRERRADVVIAIIPSGEYPATRDILRGNVRLGAGASDDLRSIATAALRVVNWVGPDRSCRRPCPT
jgi:hypothetical protein